MALPYYTPTDIEDPQSADFGEVVLACRLDYLAVLDEVIETRRKAGKITVESAKPIRAAHDKRAAIAVYLVELSEQRVEDHANSLFNSIISAFQWQKHLSAVLFHHQGFDYRITLELDHLIIVEFDSMTIQHIENGKPSKASCPVSETGWKSVHCHSSEVNEAGSYAAVIKTYFEQYVKAPTANELQLALI